MLLHGARQRVLSKSKPIQKYVESAGGDITFEFLPPYTPQLNSIETAWRDLKRRLAGRQVFQVCRRAETRDNHDRRVRDGQQTQGIPGSLINPAKNCNSKPTITHHPPDPASRLQKPQDASNNSTRGWIFAVFLRQGERIAVASTTRIS